MGEIIFQYSFIFFILSLFVNVFLCKETLLIQSIKTLDLTYEVTEMKLLKSMHCYFDELALWLERSRSEFTAVGQRAGVSVSVFVA